MRNAIKRVQSGEALTGESDEIWWMYEGHIVAISLLYDIVIFCYSNRGVKQWYTFNETGCNGYICLLSIANHTEVLHGIRDNTGHRLPPTVPQSFISQSVPRDMLNWSEGLASCIRRQYPHTYVWSWPQSHIISDRQTAAQADQQAQSAAESGYRCDFPGCQRGPFQTVEALKMHKVRSHKAHSATPKRTPQSSRVYRSTDSVYVSIPFVYKWDVKVYFPLFLLLVILYIFVY